MLLPHSENSKQIRLPSLFKKAAREREPDADFIRLEDPVADPFVTGSTFRPERWRMIPRSTVRTFTAFSAYSTISLPPGRFRFVSFSMVDILPLLSAADCRGCSHIKK